MDVAADRRARFREAIRAVSARSSSSDLLRWVLVPASVLLLLGFNAMIFGWIGAARTAREIEQIPYLISGGLIGLGLVFVGGLLLTSAFWVVVVRKLLEESEARTRALLEERLSARAELDNGRRVDADRPQRPRRQRDTARS